MNKEPTDIDFGDEAPAPRPDASPAVLTPAGNPSPIDFGADAPSASPGPSPVTFAPAAEVDAPRKAPVQAPRPTPAAAAITFTEPPASVAREVPKAPTMLASQPDSQAVEAAITRARQEFHDIVTRRPGAVEGAIRQLLPVSSRVLMGWGESALKENAALATEVADLQRRFAAMDADGLIERALEARTRSGGILHKFLARSECSESELRVRATRVQAGLAQVLPAAEDLKVRAKELGERLAILVAALSCAADVGARKADQTIRTLMQGRRTVLAQVTQQVQILGPQIKALEQQVTDQSMRLDQFINVTLPAMGLAR